MKPELLPAEVTLDAGEVLRLEAPRGLEITCEAGHLWITEEAQPDDVWLAPGQRVWLVGSGLAVLEAKGAARLRIQAVRNQAVRNQGVRVLGSLSP